MAARLDGRLSQAEEAMRRAGRWRLGFKDGPLLEAMGAVAVMMVALFVRLEFLSADAPAFVTPDSDDYLWPGYALAYGLGFEPELRRTPLYPLFIGAVLSLGGDLRSLVVSQHGLGVVTAGLTYVLGRVAFGGTGAWKYAGRGAGVVAGLMVALSGPQIIYEHYLMSEALFTLVLTLALLLLVIALRQPARRWLLLAGAGAAVACLTRPVGQVILPVVLGLPLLLALPAWRTGLQRTALIGVGLLVMMAPWTLRNLVIHGTTGAEGALGQALIGRTVRHDKGYLYDDPAHPDPNPTRATARQIIQQEMNTGEPSGGTITERVRDELGLTQAQTSALLRDLAIAEILERPAHYVDTTGEMAWELFQGRNERLLGNWRQRTTRNWDNKWEPRLVALLDRETPAEGPRYERADGVTSFFQPWRWRTSIGWLLGIGLLLAVVAPQLRPALAPGLAVVALIVAAAALDGLVWRFRYPVDPAIAVMVGVGLCGPIALAGRLLTRYRLAGRQQGVTSAAGSIGDHSEGHTDGSSAERGAGGRRVDGVVSR